MGRHGRFGEVGQNLAAAFLMMLGSPPDDGPMASESFAMGGDHDVDLVGQQQIRAMR